MSEQPVPQPLPTAPPTAVVTGAGRGIGRGIALGLAAAGWRVALLGRTAARLVDVAALAPGSLVVPVDLTEPDAVRRAAAEVGEAFAAEGGVGLLVNNAGVIERQEVPFAQDDPADLWRVMETNVRGPVLITHALLPGMLERGVGRVVNLSSGAAYRPSTAYTGYGLSKGALARFTTLLDAQHRDEGLRVFDLSPGVVATDMTASMPTWDGNTTWTPVEASAELVVAIARGELDELSGRYLRAGTDTVEDLRAHAAQILGTDARRLRIPPYGPADPIGS